MNRLQLWLPLLLVLMRHSGGGEPCPAESTMVIFQSASLAEHPTFQSPALFANFADHIPIRSSGPTRLYVGFVSDVSDQNYFCDSWSLSLAVDGDVRVVGATTEGTVAAFERDGGLRCGVSYELTEVADPDRNGGRSGVVSAVVMGLLGCLNSLNPRGTATVLAVDVLPQAAARDRPPGSSLGVIRCQNGLIGSGQPIENLLTVNGGSRFFCGCREAVLTSQADFTRFGVELDGLTCGTAVLPLDRRVGVEGRATVTSSDSPDPAAGVEAWSLSLAVTGAIESLSATTQGTAGDLAENDGFRRPDSFELTEVTEGLGNQGITSVVVLDFDEQATLPGMGTEPVLLFQFDALALDLRGSAVTVAFRDGLAGRTGPVANTVTWNGRLFRPQVEVGCSFVVGGEDCTNGIDDNHDGAIDCRDPVCYGLPECREDCTNGADDNDDGLIDCLDPRCFGVPDCEEDCNNGIDDDQNGLADCDDPGCCDDWRCGRGSHVCEPIIIVFQDAPVQGSGGLAQVPEVFAGWTPEIEVVPGRNLVVVNIVSLLTPAEEGIQGWSLSIVADGAELTGATTQETIAAVGPPGIRDPLGFEFTELVSSTAEDGTPIHGVVSGVVLALVGDVTLAPIGTATVLRLDVEVPDPVGGRMYCLDGLLPAAQEIENLVVTGGETRYPLCIEGSFVEGLLLVPTAGRFRRGDPNDDGRVNIADAIWILSELFRNGPRAPCQDAADANDDGLVNLTDAVFVTDYRFRAGSEPPAPFSACAADPTDDTGDDDPDNDLPCPVNATSCP